MGYDMVNMQKQNQCETGRGSRQMPRHLLPCLLDNLHWSLLNHHQPTILCRLGLPCMLPAAHLWRHLGLLVTVWERVSQPRCACTCTAMCHGLWGFKLYCVQVYGQWKEQWKEIAYPEVIRSSSLFPAGSANTWSPCTSGFWVGGATTTTRVSRVDVPLMYLCCDLGMAVPAWSTVGCVLVNTWLQIPVSLGEGVKSETVHLSDSWQNSKHK